MSAYEFDHTLPPGPDNPKEDISQRTEHRQVFDIGPAQKRIRVGMRPIFYRNERGDLSPISTDIENGRVYKCDYDVSLLPAGRIGYEGTDPNGKRVELELDDVTYSAPVIEGNKATYVGVSSGVDFVLTFMKQGIKAERVLHNAQAQKQGVYRSYREDGAAGKLLHMGEDRAGRKTEINTVKELPHPQGGVRIRQTWSGRVMKMDRATRVRGWSTEVEYPVRIDPTSTFNPSLNAHDGCGYVSSSVSVFINQTYTRAMSSSPAATPPYKYELFFYFPSVVIPSGATITTATLKVFSLAGNGSVQARVSSTSSPALPTAVGHVLTPVNAGAWGGTDPVSGSWVPPEQQITPDVTAAVTSLHTAYDYSSGLPMLFFTRVAAAGQFVSACMKENTVGDPELVIDYTGGGGGGWAGGELMDLADFAEAQEVTKANISNILGV